LAAACSDVVYGKLCANGRKYHAVGDTNGSDDGDDGRANGDGYGNSNGNFDLDPGTADLHSCTPYLDRYADGGTTNRYYYPTTNRHPNGRRGTSDVG
jgi:hypothetical protein